MPEPISADAEVLVHRWVDGDEVPEEPVSRAFALEILAAVVHRVKTQCYPRGRPSRAYVHFRAPFPLSRKDAPCGNDRMDPAQCMANAPVALEGRPRG